VEVRVLPCIQTRVGEVVSHEAHNLENGSSSLSPATRLTNGFTTIFKKYMNREIRSRDPVVDLVNYEDEKQKEILERGRKATT
jgi:hypothetical protein